MTTFLRTNILFSLLLLATISQGQTGNVTNAVVNITPGTIVTTNGGLILQSSGAIDNSGSIRLTGDWTNDALGLINSSPGTVEFNGAANQNIGGTATTNFYNLTINNPAGVTLQNNENVEAALSFTSGKINTATITDTLTLTANPPIPISGANTSSYVDGNLQIAIPTGNTSVKYEIGNAVYAPSALDIHGVTTAGLITGITRSGPAPNENNPVLNASGINLAAKADQYWVMDNNGTVFSNIDISFDFTNTTNTGNTANYIISKFDFPSTWTPIVATVAATTIKATIFSSRSEFVVGEPSITGVSSNHEMNSVEVFPNPAHGNLSVQINSPSSANYTVKLLDMTGRLLLSKTVKAEIGNNLFDLNLDGLSAGLYTLSLDNQQRTHNVQVAVQ